jgi:hypothetical protein
LQTTNTTTGRRTEATVQPSRRRRRSRRDHRCDAKIRRYKYLLAGITILFLLIYIFTWFYIRSLATGQEQAALALRKLDVKHQGVVKELETLRSERDALVQGRIPDLLPLHFDEAIPIETSYIRNVIFTLVKNGRNTVYEYRLVLNNDSLSIVRPKVEIFLFNELGIQIGNALVEPGDATTNNTRATLEPGEVRSYSATIKMLREGKPVYFLIAAREANGTTIEETARLPMRAYDPD